MSTYRRYQEARNAAWRALLRIPEKTLPIDPEALAALLGVDVLPFPDPRESPRLAGLAGQINPCVSLRIGGKWRIFLREGALDERQRRFALAHELGHVLLGHETRLLAPGVAAFSAPENRGDLIPDPQDQDAADADVFALRLLAPACLLHEMGLHTPQRIGTVCGLPPLAAAARAERMALLNQRNAFFTHPLERKVRNSFLPYLRAGKAAAEPGPRAPGASGRKAVPYPMPAPEKSPRPNGTNRRLRKALPAGAAIIALLILFLIGRRL